MTAIERLMTYRRARFVEAEANARERYRAIPGDVPDAVAELAYEAAAADREYWSRLYAIGLQRFYRSRRP